MSYLEEFNNGWVPENAELEGNWIVRGLLGPLPLRFFGHKKQFTKVGVNAYEGNNQFLGLLPVGYFKTSVGPSQLEPSLNVININYNVPKNLWVMKGLTDEVRFVAEDKLLGRGVYKPVGTEILSPRNIFWFTVSKS